MFIPRSMEELFEQQLDLPGDRIRGVLMGGCMGIIMAGLFAFVFFFTLLALSNGISDVNFQVSQSAIVPVACLGISALVSPVFGLLFGLRRGYSIPRHCGCFILYIGVLIGAVIVLSMFV